MKTKLLLLTVFIYGVTFGQSAFQKNYNSNNQNHYHDLNIEPAKDGSFDVIMSGNLFDASMQGYKPIVQRLDNSGTVIWALTFDGTPLQNARIFDIETIFDMAVITGSVDVGGTKRVFAAKIELATGNLLETAHYEIVSPNFNSRGLHISYTEADISGDGNPNPGFIIGGFFSDSYDLYTNAMNIGFVLRTWFDLESIWATEIDSNAGGNTDYDMVNHITETNDGYIITGATNDNSTSQQAVLAHKLDAFGNFIWDTSYVFGNSQDLSVDAYYDAATNQVYMLTNYSSTHQFGVTVIDNSTGNIALSQSWYITNNELNHYGFSIIESVTNPDNLMIVGYDRDENWVDSSGNNYTSQSNIFVYEFEKPTGNQVGNSYQYLVPHVEPSTDEFNFWNGQMPLIYYPDIATIIDDNPGASPSYYSVGYKTDPSINFTEATLYKVLSDKKNSCDNTNLSFTPNPLSKTDVTAFSGNTPVQTNLFALTTASISPVETDCSSVLSIGDINSLKESYLYPNPAQNVIYTIAEKAVKFEIYDSLGRKISMGNISQSKAISIENLKIGLYFIKVIDNENNTQTYKILKK